MFRCWITLRRAGWAIVSGAHVALLIGGGVVAGIVNTLAGAGSLLTVPLLVLVGLPGTVANGTNRVGVLCQNIAAAWRFRAEGMSGLRSAGPAVVPVGLGAFTGAFIISRVADKTFETLFGLVMVLLLIPILLRPAAATAPDAGRRWPAAVSSLVFVAVGLYGGAFQAGVGIALLFALSYAGDDLVHANSVKVVVNAALTLVALPVFIVQQQVAWVPGALLAAGFVLGGVVGVRLAVHGGERIIRPVLAVAVLALAGRMVGIY
ncbi:MAG: sulfite exporter TauE/SafE family protein [Candidatus Binatia bacterium]